MPEAPATPFLNEEAKWLETIRPEFRAAAERHGRPLFSLVMQLGAITHGLGIIAQQGRGNRAISQAVSVLQMNLEALAQTALLAAGKSTGDYAECRADIERVAALLDTGAGLPGKVSKGGIILNG